jgi:hypothetical protein
VYKGVCLASIASARSRQTPAWACHAALRNLPAHTDRLLAAVRNSSSVAQCLAQVQAMDVDEGPATFGLHPNAAIASAQQEGQLLLRAVLTMQPSAVPGGDALAGSSMAGGRHRRSAAGAESLPQHDVLPMEQRVAGLLQQLLDQLPPQLDRAQASALHDPFARLPCGRRSPLGVVLRQEMDRWVAVC